VASFPPVGLNKIVAVALGSNEGDRAAHLRYAAGALAGLLDGIQVSRHLETPPAPPAQPADPNYLNAVAVGTSSLSPRELLDRLLAIERARGRTRPHSGAPRTLDLDLILVGDMMVKEPGLEVPHPRFRDRRFVLEPLAELAPNLIDPGSGLTIRQLLVRLPPPRP
jgi:2-amino-4-hydroxy-6-hydroxymethyldihydropteridine diphosphokinase